MTSEEFDNIVGGNGKMASKTIECFCGCGMDSLQAQAWVETDDNLLAWGDSIEFQVRIVPPSLLVD